MVRIDKTVLVSCEPGWEGAWWTQCLVGYIWFCQLHFVVVSMNGLRTWLCDEVWHCKDLVMVIGKGQENGQCRTHRAIQGAGENGLQRVKILFLPDTCAALVTKVSSEILREVVPSLVIIGKQLRGSLLHLVPVLL